MKQKNLDAGRVIIMAQDEGRFGRISIPRKAWSPNGYRPKSPRQVIRQAFYVYSAICPKQGKMTCLILPYANTEMMNIFLQQVSHDFKNYQIIMQVDRAGWYLSKQLIVPDNIYLIQQPSHSPELNPVEHLWEEIREKFLYNKAFDHLDQVIEVVCKAIKTLNGNPKYITSMTSFPHLNVSL